MINYISKSPEDTKRLGERIGELLNPGAVIALDGSLGSGKTVLAKGFVMGALDLNPNLVTSPAYTLVNEYNDGVRPITIYHMDFYRLEILTNEDFELFNEYLDDELGVVLAEWGSRFLPELCAEYLIIEIGHLEGGSEVFRSIHISSYGEGDQYTFVLEKIRDYVNNHS